MADLYFAVGQTKRITQQFSINGAPSAVTAPTATETSPSGTITSLAAPTLQNSGTDPSYFLDYTPSGAAGVYLVKFKTTDATADNPIWTWINEVGALDVNVSTIAANAITAAAIATDAIDNDAIAANAVTELQSGLATAAALATAQASIDDLPTNAELVTSQAAADDATLAAIAALNNLSAAAAADAVWDEVLSGHVGVGSTGEALNAAGASGDPWTTALPGAYGAGSAGKIIGDNVNATLSSRSTQTSVDDLPTNAELATALGTADDATLAAIAALNDFDPAIDVVAHVTLADTTTMLTNAPTDMATAADQTLVKAVTDKFNTALELDGAVYRLTTNALEQAPTGAGGGLDAAQTAAAILDAVAASYNDSGSIGEKINAAGSSADPLLNLVPGAYGAGTAGNALGLIDDIKVKTDTIGALSVTVTSPVVNSHTIENIVKGDDYLLVDSTQWDFPYTGLPYSFVGATSVKLRFVQGTQMKLELTGAVLNATTVRFQPTSAQTATLPAGTLLFEVEVTLPTGIHTPTPLSSGRATVRAQAT